jgi:hypothetical protein
VPEAVIVDTQDWQDRWMPPSHPGTPEAPFDDVSITVGWNTAQLGDLHRRGGGIGVAALCAGGGMGSALVIEAF